MMNFLKYTILALVGFVSIAPVMADENTLHIYSSRHYNTDEALYDNFTKQTGIQIERVDSKGDALIARLQQEGENSPADIFITVDSGRLWRAQQAGLFQAVESDVLNTKIPSYYRDENNEWFGFSTRARVIVINANEVNENAIANYADLADPQWKDKICIRTSSNIYNLSLMASMIEIIGKADSIAWASGLKDNLARKPQGGDTDQIKAVAAGLCDIAVVNSYYFYRLMRSENPEDNKIVEGLKVIYPDQDGNGTHVNISGAGVLKHADNKDAAVQFLEYLTSDAAQTYFADGNNEYPVMGGLDYAAKAYLDNNFKTQEINVGAFGKHQKDAMKFFDVIKFP